MKSKLGAATGFGASISIRLISSLGLTSFFIFGFSSSEDSSDELCFLAFFFFFFSCDPEAGAVGVFSSI